MLVVKFSFFRWGRFENDKLSLNGVWDGYE